MTRAAFFLVLLLAVFAPRAVFAQDLEATINALSQGSYNDRAKAATALAQTGDPRVVAVLKALGDRDLYVRKSDQKVFIARSAGGGYALTDPMTGKDAGTAASAELDGIKVNNSLRRTLEALLGSLTLLSPDPAVRANAAASLFNQPAADAIDTLDAAIAKETDAGVKQLMIEARAASVLKSDRPDPEKIAAVKVLAARGDQDSLEPSAKSRSHGPGRSQGRRRRRHCRCVAVLALWNNVQNLWYGISLGSVLLLAAIGLAITFGVMGVINMAHGEMVMIGAYTTYVVQEVFRSSFPGAFDYSLFVALPAAFLIAGLIGIGLERGIIRFLYGRPLETLLATWGLSLILQQTVRTIFGPLEPRGRHAVMDERHRGDHSRPDAHLRTASPSSPSRGIVFVVLMLVMRYTTFGLQMRAVTQNRSMANSVGIRSAWVDAMTFGLGSAIAGVAGVALSQIDNVSPNLGQSYIIEFVPGGGVRRGRQPLGHAGRRLVARHSQQVSGALGGRRARQDPHPGDGHSVHTKTAARALRAQGPRGGGIDMETRRTPLLGIPMGSADWIFLAVLTAVIIVVPVLNLMTSPRLGVAHARPTW